MLPRLHLRLKGKSLNIGMKSTGFRIGLCLGLWFIGFSLSTQAVQEEKILSTPQGISVVFWEMPQASPVSLYIGFKDTGFQSGSTGSALRALVARSLQKGVKEHVQASTTLPFASLHFGDCYFNLTGFNLNLESNAAQLPEALQLLMRSLQLNFVDLPQFKQAQRDFIVELQTQIAAEKKRKNATLVESKPEVRIFKMDALEQFAEQQVACQLGQPDWSEAALLKSVKRLRWQDMQHYAAHYFTRDRLIIAVAGPIQTKLLLQAIDDSLGQLPIRSSVQEDTMLLRRTKPVKRPAKQFFYQNDKKMPHIICFGHPLPVDVSIDRYTRGILTTLIANMAGFYMHQETPTMAIEEEYYPLVNTLGIDHREGLRCLRGCFIGHNQTAALRRAKIEQFFKEFKAQGVNAPWFPRYLAQLKKDNIVEQWREKSIKEITLSAQEIKTNSSFAAFYLFNKQTEALLKLPGLSEYINYLEQVRVEDVIPLMQALFDPDQLVLTEVGTENHLLQK
jgi:predicted Zn-dependent peptidase